MGTAVSVLAILFALLHIAAAIAQLKSKDPAARGSATMMTCGGIAVACAAIAHLAGGHILHADALSTAVGSMLICFAACLNGKRAGKINPLHHIIRGGIAVLLVVGFILW